MKHTFAIPFAAALLASSAAFAADLPAAVAPTYAPAAVTPFNWSGVYFGAQGGYGWGSTSQSFEGGAPSGNSNPQGWLGGGYLGFNWQLNNVVLGLEGDFEGADLNGSFRNNSGATSAGSADMNWDASIRGRLGWPLTARSSMSPAASPLPTMTSRAAPISARPSPAAGSPIRSPAGLSAPASSRPGPGTSPPGSSIATPTTAARAAASRRFSRA